MAFKIKILASFLLIVLALNVEAQNKFNKPHRLIDKLEFTHSDDEPGMYLKLSVAGIKYCQKDLKNNTYTVAKIVKKLHNKMVGGSSQLRTKCIANQIYYHVIFYDTNKSSSSTSPNRKLLRKIEKYVKISKIKKFARKFSNKSANPINANYVELLVNGCRYSRYVVPPNVFK